MQQEIEGKLSKLKEFTIEEYYEAFCDTEQWLEDLEGLVGPKQEHRDEIKGLCEKLTKDFSEYPVWMKIHLLSFCMKCSEELQYAEWLMQEILDADYNVLGEYNKYFLYWQITVSIFEHTHLQSKKTEQGRAVLYRELYDAFYHALHLEQYPYIPLKERNQNLVFLFTSQFLSDLHAPTKTICDRAYFLQKYLGKRAVIINTAMLLPEKGDTPFYDRKIGEYLLDYRTVSQIAFRGEQFEYIQCENNMPDLNTIQIFLQKVKEEKPYCIISIGDGNICADLCGNIVPEIAVGTVHSEVAVTTARYQVTEKELSESDQKILEILGVEPENVKKALFTYVFKEQEHHFKRAELGLTEDKIILLVTGWRLGDEADEEFLHMLEETVCTIHETEVVFMGLFEGYEKSMERFPRLSARSHYFPYQEDALAVTECCDIYVNPKRKGGGSSAAEALFMGLPVVTLPFGDVAAAAGERFQVKDYEKMKDQIRRYCQDKAFYNEMASFARQRAEDLTDSKTHFCELFREIEQSPDFW